MPPRTRSTPIQKASWRGRGGGAGSRSLLFYRRAVTTGLSIILLACFIALLWFLWSSQSSPLATSVIFTEPKQGSAPPSGFAEHDKLAVAKVLRDRFGDKWVTDPPENTVLDAAHLSETLTTTFAKAASADSRQNVLLYVSGHGVSGTLVGESQEDAYLLPVDFSPTDKPDRQLAVGKLLAEVAALRAQCKVLAIDYGLIERDLRLGTAVNRFAEILESELRGLALPEGETLVVITSHRTWEKSLVAHTANGQGRGIFSYFFTAALGSEGHENTADAVHPDGDGPDEQITVAELAKFVQSQVSDWAWENTGYLRTQRPLVLVKAGTNPVVAIETSESFEPDSEEARALAALAEVVLCRTPDKPKGDEKDKANPPADGKENGASKSAAMLRGGWSLSLVQGAPNEPAAAGKSDSAPPASETKPANVTSSPAAAEAAPAAATLATTPPAAPLPTGWFADQVALLSSLEGDGKEWSPTDFTPTGVREQLDFLLDLQQRERVGLRPRNDSVPELRTSSADQTGWRPASVTEVNAAPWTNAVRTRNAVLLELPLLVDAVDRLVGEDAGRVRDELDDLLGALEKLMLLTDRDVLTETRENTSATIYAPLPLTKTKCDTTALSLPLAQLDAARAKLRASLQGVLTELPATPPPTAEQSEAAWLNTWELGQAIPLALIERRNLPPDWKPPVLSVRKPQASATKTTPTLITPEAVRNARIAEAKNWLLWQIRLAGLMGASPLPGSNQFASAGAGDADKLNAVAVQLRDLHLTAAKNWASFNATVPKASEHLRADALARLALLLAGNPTQLPRPGERLTGEAPPIRLQFTGPLQAGASAATQVAADQAIHLSKDEPTSVAWHVRTDDPLDRDKVLVELRFDPADLRVRTKGEQDLAPTQPGQGPIPLDAILVDGQPQLLVQASREVRPDEAMAPGGNSKPLALTLRLGERSVQGAARFQLPDPRFLEVQVAGFKPNVRRGAEVAVPADMGRSWFKMPPDDNQSPRRPESGDFRIELFPFPRFATEFGLRLISAKERKLTATWYVPPRDIVPTQWPDWSRNLDAMPKYARTATIAPGGTWQVPLFEAAPPAPPPAGTTPPPPMPEALVIENGLLLILTDEQEPGWRQRIWLHARPLHPDQYLTMSAEYRPGKPPMTPDTVAGAIDSLASVREQLRPGALPVTWFELADARIGRPPPAPRDYSLPNQPPVVAQLLPEAEPSGRSILAILNLEGYPRAARFAGIRQAEGPVEHERKPYLYFQLFEELLPAAPPPAGAPAPPPNLKLLAGTKYTSVPPKLAYKVFADFDSRLGQSLRVTKNGDSAGPLVRRSEDREFKIFARKPENPTGPQLVLDCQIGEWQGSFGEVDWLQAGQNVIRAEIVAAQEGLEQPIAADDCQVEYAIVLDDEQPKVSTDVTVSSIPTRFVGETVLCRFRVTDKSLVGAEVTSGVAVEGLAWGLEVKGDALVQPRPILETVKHGPNKPGQDATDRTLLCELPAEIATAKPGRVRIYVQATDRAGNVSLPVKVYELEVKMKRELELIPGSGKAAKAKS